jgi:hypothetical protein
MQYDLEELKKEYSAKSIKELVEPIQGTYGLACLLRYLRDTARYKEHEGYQDKTFEEFVVGALEMDLKDYDFLMWLYFPNEDEKMEPDSATYWRGKALRQEKKLKELEKEKDALKLKLGITKVH